MRQAVVKAKVAGDVARRSPCAKASRCSAGQMIARIDTADLESRLVDRSGALESARAQLALAEKTRAMNVRLLNDKFISQNAFDSAESSFNVARGNVKSAEAQVQLAQNALQRRRGDGAAVRHRRQAPCAAGREGRRSRRRS